MNVVHPPFNNVKVRYAIAYAIPYQEIMDAAMYGLAKPMFGAPSNTPTELRGRNRTDYTPILARPKR